MLHRYCYHYLSHSGSWVVDWTNWQMNRRVSSLKRSWDYYVVLLTSYPMWSTLRKCSRDQIRAAKVRFSFLPPARNAEWRLLKFFSSYTASDELLPQKGKDEEYDAIVAEINGVEGKLEEALSELEDQVGYVVLWSNPWSLGRCVNVNIGSSLPTGIVRPVTRCVRARILLW